MSDFEDRMARLRPARAPEALWNRIQEGRPAPVRRRPAFKDAWIVAAAAGLLAALFFVMAAPPEEIQTPVAPLTPDQLREQLKAYPHRVVCESYRDGNWELYLMNADGSNPVNLTNTPDVDELYPKASPDGSKICFVADEGHGAAKRRNLFYMQADGSGRTKVADNAREPCWKADGSEIAYLPGKLSKFTYSDFATRGLRIYTLDTKQTRDHPNTKLQHLYTLNWSRDSRWFVSTVHGAMGFKHGIVAIEANGNGVYDLKLGGCRPDLSPDGRRIIWGNGDFAIGMADIDLSITPPTVSNRRNVVWSENPIETYHSDWSPDGKYLTFSLGPKFTKKNLKGLLPEFPGVVAPGWDTCVADATQNNVWVKITEDGKSNKEADWVLQGAGQ